MPSLLQFIAHINIPSLLQVIGHIYMPSMLQIIALFLCSNEKGKAFKLNLEELIENNKDVLLELTVIPNPLPLKTYLSLSILI